MSGPVWLVTGASSGFGRAIALEALKRGHQVLASSRKLSSLHDLRQAGAKIYELDVTWDYSRIQKEVDRMHNDVGHFDILVNGAAYVLEGALEETSPEQTKAQFACNVFGTMNVIRSVLPYMRTQRSGIIANFGSIGSWRGGAGISNYNTTKWAITGLSESLDLELRPLGIVCVVIEPGYFRTNLLNPERRQLSATQIEDYTNTMAGQVRMKLVELDGNQRGDVVKAAKIIVDVLTRSGVDEHKQIPKRLVLGEDCVMGIKEKCESTLNLLKEWEVVVSSTDHY